MRKKDEKQKKIVKKHVKKPIIKKVALKKKTSKVSQSAIKKSSVKKSTTPKRKSRVEKIPLVYAADWNAFYAVNGSVLRSLNDLYNELETMNEGEYLYHKESGDHFANWARETLMDDVCAKDLTKASSRTKARASLKKHLKRYDI